MVDSIIVEHLSHRFDGRFVLQDLTYQVRQGEVFALVGTGSFQQETEHSRIAPVKKNQ